MCPRTPLVKNRSGVAVMLTLTHAFTLLCCGGCERASVPPNKNIQPNKNIHQVQTPTKNIDLVQTPTNNIDQAQAPTKNSDQDGKSTRTIEYWNSSAQQLEGLNQLVRNRKVTEEALMIPSRALLNLRVDGVDPDAVGTITMIAIGLRDQATQIRTLTARSLLMGFQAGKADAAGMQKAIAFGLNEGETQRKRFTELDNAATITRAKLQARYSVSFTEISFGAFTGAK